jgi:L-threonylcarbamoyladenylate synthase
VQTIVRPVADCRQDSAAIEEAAGIIRSGSVVAFPTETVYGLGANALDEAAVRRIFDIKGRPASNPVIVHVSSMEMARQLVLEWPEAAARLAHQFWPGPLTLVLRAGRDIPGAVTAGGATVGIRMPNHVVALELIRVSGVPIAAPSANLSMEVSPTTADHVLHSLGGRIPLILDAGATTGGLESSVVAFEPEIVLLRPGLISRDQLAAVTGQPIAVRAASTDGEKKPKIAKSPGMMRRHYAPRASLVVVEGSGFDQVVELLKSRKRVGWMPFGQSAAAPNEGELSDYPLVKTVTMPTDPAGYSSILYSVLHSMDDEALDVIVLELPPRDVQWEAVLDRIMRASAGPQEQ